MPREILTPTQIALLQALGAEGFFRKNFYLTGGTALAAFYLHHRYSEDLDFFSMNEVDTLPIVAFFKKHKGDLGIVDTTSETSMNRNLFFLKIGGETLKTEFTYFPFPQMETPQEHFGMPVDSVKDIAVNKLFAIYQRSKARDYIDLYCIQKQYGWTMAELVAWAKIKFDWHIDPVQLATQFSKAPMAQDHPRMIAALPEEEWQKFFENAALTLKPEILK
ncbi:MAG TPA: nucleotidyl transferase AbiEii/AbiGii toxin family protein [Candidatus Paceibacterota bacterium]|nr:nucleotidyl transferase AbiEii/AbiGii toxin family protein [Candidatus Paceibacterota bacterium]